MKRFKKILGVVDLTQSPRMLLDRAVKLAQNNQAELTIVCVVPALMKVIQSDGDIKLYSDLQEASIAEAQKKLDEAVDVYRDSSDIRTKVLLGTEFLEVIQEVLRNQHDLVIKSPENPSWLDRIFGSDDMHLLRKCPCPVWMVKQSHTDTYRRILVAIDVHDNQLTQESDLSHELNMQLLEMAESLALSEFAELHVVHSWCAVGENTLQSLVVSHSETTADNYIESTRALHSLAFDKITSEVFDGKEIDASNYINPQKHLLKGTAEETIPRLSSDLEADLVVMGTLGRTGIPGFFIGNTAEAILEQINCSVMAVKPPGFTTPVSLD